MRLRLLELRNYRRHPRTVIEWPDGVMAVLGPNGAGKSTILEAIGFALFGVPATRTGKALLRFDGAGPMDTVSVSLEFELGGEAIRVHRELKGKGLTPSATLTVGGRLAVDPGAGSNEAVTAAMQERLGMDRDTFFTTIVAQQGDLARLASMVPAKRKQLILEMMGIDALDRAIESARRRGNELGQQVEAMRRMQPDLGALQDAKASAKQALAQAKNDQKVADAAWAEAKKALAVVEKEGEGLAKQQQEHDALRHRVDDAKRDLATANTDLDRVRKQVESSAAASKQVQRLATDAARYPALQERAQQVRALAASQAAYDKALQTIDAQRKQVTSLQTDDLPDPDSIQADLERTSKSERDAAQAMAVAASTRQRAQDHIDALQDLGIDAPCPTCDQPLGDHLPDLRGRLEKEVEQATADHAAAERQQQAATAENKRLTALHQRATRLQEAEEHLARLEKDLPVKPETSKDNTSLQGDLQKAKKAHEETLRLSRDVESLGSLQAEQGQMQRTVTALEGTVKDAGTKLAAATDPRPAVEAHRKALHDTQTHERDAERRSIAASHAVASVEKDLSTAEQRIAEAKKAAGTIKETEDEARYWAALAAGRGQGLLEAFKAHLVARIGPAVSQEASRLLTRFTGGRYTEVWLDSDYKLFVADGGTRYELDRFSGGETDLVHLALRLAVSRLLLERSGATELRFLALDEVFGSLDSQRRDLVLSALQELGTIYSQVLLVTHQDSLRDALDAALMVEERDGASVVTLHAG